jgi:hypothetical protein
MSFKKTAAAVLLAGGIATAGGMAWAAWSAGGSGSGRSASLTAQTITVTAVTGTADLYPGFQNGDVYFTLTNPNPYPVRFTDMVSGTVTSSDTTNCPSSNVTVDASASGLALDVGANATSATLSIADVVNMASNAPDGCQGKTFNIVLTLTGTQN